jgi:hypothetical protein
MFKKLISASAFSLIVSTSGGAAVCISETSCSPAQVAVIDSQVPADVLADVECAAAQLLQGALTDPMQILTQCGPLLVSQLVALAEDLLATPAVSSDGGAVTPPSAGDGGALVASNKPRVLPAHLANITLSDAQRSRIQAIHDAALKLVDGGS